MRMESPLNQRLRRSPPDVVYTPIDVTSSLLIYSAPDTAKVAHIQRMRKVSVNFKEGKTVLTGEARVDPNSPTADKNPEYLAKYKKGIADLGMTPDEFAYEYRIAVRVTPIEDAWLIARLAA